MSGYDKDWLRLARIDTAHYCNEIRAHVKAGQFISAMAKARRLADLLNTMANVQAQLRVG